eukprot:COSAG04_NODE_26446_length_294_cov_1.682051_1_plen_75_part_10
MRERQWCEHATLLTPRSVFFTAFGRCAALKPETVEFFQRWVQLNQRLANGTLAFDEPDVAAWAAAEGHPALVLFL